MLAIMLESIQHTTPRIPESGLHLNSYSFTEHEYHFQGVLNVQLLVALVCYVGISL
jgi:hypothetical protein